jgi:hypothetical protein
VDAPWYVSNFVIRKDLQISTVKEEMRFSEERKKKKKTVVGLERGPLSLVSTIEELLDRKVAAPV